MPASTASDPSRLELVVLSSADAIAGVRCAVEIFACRCGLDEKSAADAGLCVNEAMANIIRHAYQGAADGRIEIIAHQATGTFHISLRDWGKGVNPAAGPLELHNPAKPGGVGLLCIHTLMDTVRFIPQPDGMLLIMSKGGAGHHAVPDEEIGRP